MDKIKELISSLSVPGHSFKAGVPASSETFAAMQSNSTILWNAVLSCWVHDCQRFRTTQATKYPVIQHNFPGVNYLSLHFHNYIITPNHKNFFSQK
jgi:hypothetical protein